MNNCCGNCKHWVNTRTTEKGRLPYWGECDAGYPIKAGGWFTRKGNKFRYATFKIRSDRACKCWEGEK